MQTKPELELADADRILAAARAEAERNGWAVSIAVVDDGGHLLAFARLDGASPASAAIAQDKARAAALSRRDTKAYEDMINGGRTAFLSAPLSGLLEGGVPVTAGGRVAGAIGVSGVKSVQDAQIARAGAQSVAD
ncbi:GlcG/HbpS family heme-binding protein [Burkholderia multivorans]|uniref:GlcG/HbpS family heme-binding protein n=1 Tax=Burkholderia multivorans TaxID=87883 RepID=UPI000F4DDE50|nr:heme-binding protein [Burkholderia multivorans]AYY55488.1 heme-binding protein [Burkholderia multivorans]MCA8438901.1 heme-binding protein [Burkholderia multivorans]